MQRGLVSTKKKLSELQSAQILVGLKYLYLGLAYLLCLSSSIVKRSLSRRYSALLTMITPVVHEKSTTEKEQNSTSIYSLSLEKVYPVCMQESPYFYHHVCIWMVSLPQFRAIALVKLMLFRIFLIPRMFPLFSVFLFPLHGNLVTFSYDP